MKKHEISTPIPALNLEVTKKFLCHLRFTGLTGQYIAPNEVKGNQDSDSEEQATIKTLQAAMNTFNSQHPTPVLSSEQHAIVKKAYYELLKDGLINIEALKACFFYEVILPEHLGRFFRSIAGYTRSKDLREILTELHFTLTLGHEPLSLAQKASCLLFWLSSFKYNTGTEYYYKLLNVLLFYRIVNSYSKITDRRFSYIRGESIFSADDSSATQVIDKMVAFATQDFRYAQRASKVHFSPY